MQKPKRIQLRFLVIICILFAALVMVSHYARKPLDWKMTFDYSHKAPYGCYVLNDMYEPLFNREISYNNASLYNNPLITDVEGKNLVIITNMFKPDETETADLFEFAANGNDVFISAFEMPEEFLDTFNLSLNISFIDSAFLKQNPDRLNFFNPVLQKDSGYVFRRMMRKGYFKTDENFKGTLLGNDFSDHVNFLAIPWGKGRIFLHSQPLVFTNLQILDGNYEYAVNALSYLPDQPVIVDRYYKPFRVTNSSPTKFILSKAPLRSAYYLILFSLLVYLTFGARRKQRIIPLIEPLRNTSADFIKTVGRLYFKTGNHANIAQKKTIYLKDFLRERYYIRDISLAGGDIELISSKTGVEESLVRKLVKEMEFFEGRKKITESALIAYHKDMQEFYRNCL
ncbi:MAG TPA: DUF4350 domain-containing protein [Bacteroidales bacterium]|nr:DUF4350 domain-containing protein [Bacteroidales bacterium]